MLNADVLVRLEALIDYCKAQCDGEYDWEMLQHLLEAVRGAAGHGPELQGLYEHLRPYIEQRLLTLREDDVGDT